MSKAFNKHIARAEILKTNKHFKILFTSLIIKENSNYKEVPFFHSTEWLKQQLRISSIGEDGR